VRVLLDENLPRRLKSQFPDDVEVVTVPERGWSGMKNGELLSLAVKEFEVFVTMDSGIEYQQNLAGFPIGIIILHAATNRLVDLQPLMPEVNKQLRTIRPAQPIHIGT
jgi:predicted nuclease of predicted toxin-antitoxin system